MRNIALVLLALILLSGCNLFTVRDADPPGTAAPWNDYADSLKYALQNLEYCYEDSRNAVHYTGIFRQDFLFHFAPQDVSDYSISPTWSRVEEQDMIQLFHTRYTDVEVELSSADNADIISSNDAVLYRVYSITGVLRQSGAERQILAAGKMELQYKKEYGYWYLNKWYDYRGTGVNTWGKLKYENY